MKRYLKITWGIRKILNRSIALYFPFASSGKETAFFSLKTIFLVTIIFLSISIKVNSQSKKISFQNISIEQGLSQSSIFTVLEDSKGFM